jgi:hypothetical protein
VIGVLAGNTFVTANLRYDLPAIYNARDYKTMIAAGVLPTTGVIQDFTTGWLGVFFAQYQPGVPFSGQFSQIGIETSRSGIRWFIYAEPGVTCLRGTQPPGDHLHCYGDYNDLVSLLTWHTLRLQKLTNENFWRVYFYDTNNVGYIVGAIESTSNRIYLARNDTEEGYYEATNPFLDMAYYYWHPQYWNGSSWVEWAASEGSGKNNEIWISGANPQGICPGHYGANPYLGGDERAWYAGTTGQYCSWVLFPSSHTYLTLVQK